MYSLLFWLGILMWVSIPPLSVDKIMVCHSHIMTRHKFHEQKFRPCRGLPPKSHPIRPTPYPDKYWSPCHWLRTIQKSMSLRFITNQVCLKGYLVLQLSLQSATIDLKIRLIVWLCFQSNRSLWSPFLKVRLIRDSNYARLNVLSNRQNDKVHLDNLRCVVLAFLDSCPYVWPWIYIRRKRYYDDSTRSGILIVFLFTVAAWKSKVNKCVNATSIL